MRTISQVAKLTGISVRTLQYYDKIGLLKPSQLTASGYRLYDDNSLQKLQQILFFKELGFKLTEIQEILQNPDFDRLHAFRQQKELLLIKRNRTDRLIQLLSRLEKGETCMSFKEFDLTEYIDALERFKSNNVEEIEKHWGSIDKFNQFIQKIKADEEDVAKLAIKQFGSVEKYTEAMKYNLEHFSEIMEKMQTTDTTALLRKSDALYTRLTSDMSRDIRSDEIQDTVREIVTFTEETSPGNSGEYFWDIVIESYSHDLVKKATDEKYGIGAAEYITEAMKYYFQK